MERQLWVDHVFNLGLDPGWAHNIVSRLQDAHGRIEHICAPWDEEILTWKSNDAWSIKEHIGHLIDLEPLHRKRLKEFSNFTSELTMADMSNAATQKADHNQTPLNDLLLHFSEGRVDFIKDYFDLPEASLHHEAIHPRLKVPMKPVDLLFFVAEHDDHHITTIKEIIDSRIL